MAETQTTQDTLPTPDIATLTGGDKGLLDSFICLDKAKLIDDTKITRDADKRMTQDQARLDAAFKAEGVSAAELPRPWDANKEHAKFEHNPIEGFGSVGGLFAMVASAFTKAPMENAINGMAGAINSIKAGDEAAYERAHQSWKDNTKLALDRFKTQHELYSDAMGLFDHDVSAANAKLHNAAVRFGDNQMLMLAEHGMVKEMFELQAARVKAADQMVEFQDKLTYRSFQKAAVEAELKSIPPSDDPNKDKLIKATMAMKILDPHGKMGSAEQEAVGNYVMRTNPNDPKYVDGLIDIHQQFSPKASNISGYQEARDKIVAEKGSISAEEDAKLLHDFGLSGSRVSLSGAGGDPNSSQKIKAAAILEIQKKAKAGGKDMTLAEAEHEYNIKRAAPSGNRQDDLQSKIDQTDNIIHGSEKNLDFLRTYKGGAGLMGKIMRGEEIASNIVGAGTQSDRVAFRRRVHELQEMVPRIITDSNGRPLQAAQDKVDDFVAGLNAGDTGPNTIRAYEDLIAEMQKRQSDYRKRKSGSESAAPGDADKKPDADWL